MWKISKIWNFEHPQKFQFRKSQKILILKIPKNSNFKNPQKFRFGNPKNFQFKKFQCRTLISKNLVSIIYNYRRNNFPAYQITQRCFQILKKYLFSLMFFLATRYS